MVDYVDFARVRELPEFAQIDTVYFVQPNAEQPIRQFVTGDDGVPVEIAAATAAQQLFDAGLIDAPTVTAMSAYLTPAISAGEVRTVPPGTPASVENVGSGNDVVLDFAIPAGAAATLAVGNVTTGAPGSPVVVENVGTPDAAVLDIRLPAGQTGASDNTYTSYAALLASDKTRKTARLVGDTDVPPQPDGPFNVVAGVWAGQGAAGITFGTRTVDDKLREIVSVTDGRFAGGAKADCVYNIETDQITSGTDSTAAFLAAFAAGQPFTVPPGWYRISSVSLFDMSSKPTMYLQEGAWIVAQPPRYNGTQNPFISAFLFMRCPGAKVIGASKYGCGVYVQGLSEANGVSMVHCGGGEVITKLSIIKGPTADVAITDDTFQTPWTILNATGGNPGNLPSNASVTDVFSDGFAHYGGQWYGGLSGGECLRNSFGTRTGRPDQPNSHGCALAITRGVGPLLVADCDMRGQKEFAILGSSAGLTSRDVTIRNNFMDDCGRGSISWTEEANLASVVGQGTLRLTISGNSCTGTGKGGYTSGYAGIRAGSYDGVGFIDDLNIFDNTFDDNTQFDILIQSNSTVGTQVDNVSIYRNIRKGGDRILYSLAIGAGVGVARHQDIYSGAADKAVFDAQSYFNPLTLLADFTNILGSEFVAPSYTVSATIGVKTWGRVDGTPGQTLAILPAGYRPQANIAFGGGGLGLGSVRMDGHISADAGPGPWDLSSIPAFQPYAKK